MSDRPRVALLTAVVACGAAAVMSASLLPRGAAGISQRTRVDTGTILVGLSRGLVGDRDRLREGISLVGTYSGARGWRQAGGEEFMRLLPDGGTWTVYELGAPPTKVVSGRPHLEPGGPEDGPSFVSALKQPLRTAHPGQWIAVHGTAFVDRGDVQVLPATMDRTVEAIRREAQRLGYWKSPEATLNQNISVDLDGDSRRDRVLAIYEGTDREQGPEAGPVDVVLAAIQNRDGTFRLTALTQPDWQRIRAWGGFLTAGVLAVADLNGDGTREIAVQLNSNDYIGLSVHAVRQGHFEEVLYTREGSEH